MGPALKAEASDVRYGNEPLSHVTAHQTHLSVQVATGHGEPVTAVGNLTGEAGAGGCIWRHEPPTICIRRARFGAFRITSQPNRQGHPSSGSSGIPASGGWPEYRVTSVEVARCQPLPGRSRRSQRSQGQAHVCSQLHQRLKLYGSGRHAPPACCSAHVAPEEVRLITYYGPSSCMVVLTAAPCRPPGLPAT